VQVTEGLVEREPGSQARRPTAAIVLKSVRIRGLLGGPDIEKQFISDLR